MKTSTYLLFLSVVGRGPTKSIDTHWKGLLAMGALIIFMGEVGFPFKILQTCQSLINL